MDIKLTPWTRGLIYHIVYDLIIYGVQDTEDLDFILRDFVYLFQRDGCTILPISETIKKVYKVSDIYGYNPVEKSYIRAKYLIPKYYYREELEAILDCRNKYLPGLPSRYLRLSTDGQKSKTQVELEGKNDLLSLTWQRGKGFDPGSW